jgi:myo-inositol-1(or 4)-monophosphatase
MDYSTELDVALRLARQAGEIQLAGQDGALGIERKADDSPVTRVDQACEEAILSGIREAFPDDGFLGEETGEHAGGSGRTWIVDPIDGTRPFIRGIPTYGCLIGLQAGGEQVVGVINLAALKEIYYASLGGGAFVSDQPIRVSDVRELNSATGSALGERDRRDEPVGQRLLGAMAEWDYSYGFMDSYSYCCVAAGRLDLCVSILDRAWDRAAAACIVSEAGGTYSDIAGKRTIYSDSFILSNGHLHDAILARLQGNA